MATAIASISPSMPGMANSPIPTRVEAGLLAPKSSR
jgi:hypothetical protein